MNLKNVEVMETSLKNPVAYKLTVSEKLGRVALVTAVTAVTAATASPAFAADIDVSSIVTTITGFIAVVSSIGLAVLSLIVTGKVFKWVRTAL
jgi:hypothetical protein